MVAKRTRQTAPSAGADGVGREPETRSFSEPPCAHAGDSGDPAGAAASDAAVEGFGHERVKQESHDFAQLGLSAASDQMTHDPALQRAGMVDDEPWAAPAAAASRREPIDEQDLNEIAADDVGATAFAERTQKEAER
jgi:hypothetical protein